MQSVHNVTIRLRNERTSHRPAGETRNLGEISRAPGSVRRMLHPRECCMILGPGRWTSGVASEPASPAEMRRRSDAACHLRGSQQCHARCCSRGRVLVHDPECSRFQTCKGGMERESKAQHGVTRSSADQWTRVRSRKLSCSRESLRRLPGRQHVQDQCLASGCRKCLVRDSVEWKRRTRVVGLHHVSSWLEPDRKNPGQAPLLWSARKLAIQATARSSGQVLAAVASCSRRRLGSCAFLAAVASVVFYAQVCRRQGISYYLARARERLPAEGFWHTSTSFHTVDTMAV